MSMMTTLAITKYNAECKRLGIQIFGPDLGHVCKRGCSMSEVMPSVYVCKESRNVHECGDGCTYRDIVDDVCVLTGRCARTSRLVYYSPYTSDDAPARSNYNTHPVRIPRARLGKRSFCDTQCKQVIVTTMRMILCGPDRHRIYQEQRDVICTRIKCYTRFNTIGILIPAIISEVRYGCSKGTALLRPAVDCDETSTMIDTYAGAILEYMHRLKSSGDEIVITRKSVLVFTACMCERLSVGLTVSGVVVIAAVKWFSLHVPNENKFSEFPGLKCRMMTKMNRSIQKIIVGKSGDVNSRMIFDPFKK